MFRLSVVAMCVNRCYCFFDNDRLRGAYYVR